MWSLGNILELNKSYFPASFSAKNGIKSLFPAQYTGSIKILSTYVYTRTGSIDGYMKYFIAADGQGRWYYTWTTTLATVPFNTSVRSGFVFLYFDTDIGHGYVDTSPPPPNAQSCNGGVDPWIAENWVKVFQSDVYVDFQAASGFDSLPSESHIWTDAGFAESNFQQLNGSHDACTGDGSGSNIFPQEEQNIFVALQVRDGSLWNSLENLPPDKFMQVWNGAQPSKATLEFMVNHFSVRYISEDSRILILAGSARSFATVLFRPIRFPILWDSGSSIVAGSARPFALPMWSSTQESGWSTALWGYGMMFAGGVAVLGAIALGPELAFLAGAFYIVGGAAMLTGAGIEGYGILQMFNATATPTSITANASPIPATTSPPPTITINVSNNSAVNVYLNNTPPSIPVEGGASIPVTSSAPYFVQITPATLIPPSSNNPSGTILVNGTCVDPAAGTQSPVSIAVAGPTLTYANVDAICSTSTITPIELDDPDDPFGP